MDALKELPNLCPPGASSTRRTIHQQSKHLTSKVRNRKELPSPIDGWSRFKWPHLTRNKSQKWNDGWICTTNRTQDEQTPFWNDGRKGTTDARNKSCSDNPVPKTMVHQGLKVMANAAHRPTANSEFCSRQMPRPPQFNYSRTGSERCPAVDVAFLTETHHLFVLFQSAGNSPHGQKEVPYAGRPRISFLSTSCYSSKVLDFVFRHAQSQSWSFLTARKSDTLASSLSADLRDSGTRQRDFQCAGVSSGVFPKLPFFSKNSQPLTTSLIEHLLMPFCRQGTVACWLSSTHILRDLRLSATAILYSLEESTSQRNLVMRSTTPSWAASKIRRGADELMHGREPYVLIYSVGQLMQEVPQIYNALIRLENRHIRQYSSESHQISQIRTITRQDSLQ